MSSPIHEGGAEYGHLNKAIVMEQTPSRAFTVLGAKYWIDEVRMPTESGAIDMNKTAEHVGADLLITDLDRHGYTDIEGRKRPLISLGNSPHYKIEIGTTFGHELGHLFLRTVVGPMFMNGRTRDEHRKEESLCDYFGVQMALPPEEIQKHEKIDGEAVIALSETYQVTVMQALAQVMRHRKLTRQLRYVGWFKYIPPEHSEVPEVRQKTICIDCLDKTGQHGHLPLDQLPFIDLRNADAQWEGPTASMTMKSQDTRALRLALSEQNNHPTLF